MIPLYDHQKKIIDEDKTHTGLFLGTGASKTRTALHLSRGKTLIIVPKQQKLDNLWNREAKKFDIHLDMTTISKEELRRDWRILPAYDTVIIDEVHNNLGVSPETRQRNKILIPRTSQIFEATLGYLKKYPPKRLYLCSATPVSKPFHLWAIATLYGRDWNFFRFREKYYFPIKVGFKQIWLPRKDKETKNKLAELVKGFGYTGALADFLDVPEQTHIEKHFELTPEQKVAIKHISDSEADPLVKRAKMRTIENGILYKQNIELVSEGVDKLVKGVDIFPSEKIDYILERAVEFPKLLIFAQYTAQIKEISKALQDEGYNVFELTGATKDRATVIQDAEKAEEAIVVAQSSVSSGWEFPSCPCVIFASKSWRFVDYEQALGRVLRANALKKNLYIHLIVKGADSDCHEAIMSGSDFQEKVMSNE